MPIYTDNMPITRPALLVDEKVCRGNIEKMSDLARQSDIIFHPHFKTHQSKAIGHWFRDYAISAITVSSVRMAEYFAQDHWKDITIAFPVNLRELVNIKHLSEIIRLTLLVENDYSVSVLDKELNQQTDIFIEIDTGYHRTGILWKNIAQIDRILRILQNSKKLRFKGFLSHTGNTYCARSKEEIILFHHEAVSRLNMLKDLYVSVFPDMILSLGDTPSFSLLAAVADIDEMRPGNFVFYDLMQQQLGACSYDRIATVLACPVVSVYPERNEVIVYGGAIHFSKEYILVNNQKIFGLAAEYANTGWQPAEPPAYVISLSQEHGIVRMNGRQLKKIRPGDILEFFPVHACLTSNLMKGYLTTDGKHLDHMEGSKSQSF